MNKDTVLGAGGVQSDWAVWTGGMAVPAKRVAPEATEEPHQAPQMENGAEVSTLKAQNDLLERENELLRQRLTVADRQVEVKDSQINDFKAITENLTRQNQVLLMLAQGVPMNRILGERGQEIEVRPGRASKARRNVGRTGGAGKVDDAVREMIVSRLRELASEGMTQRRMAEVLNEEMITTLSGAGRWDRRKVGKLTRATL